MQESNKEHKEVARNPVSIDRKQEKKTLNLYASDVFAGIVLDLS